MYTHPIDAGFRGESGHELAHRTMSLDSLLATWRQAFKSEVINLKTAKELGLTITRDFLLIADEVIE